MHVLRLASLRWSWCAVLFTGHPALALAQAPPNAPAAPAASPLQASPTEGSSAAPAPPADAGAPAPSGFQPAPSPLLAPAPGPAAGAPVQPAPTYSQGYPPYPPPPEPYYAPYPPPPDYPAGQPYPGRRRREPGLGAREHDGFFLRFNVGVGAGGGQYKERVADGRPVSRVKTRGVAGSFQVAIGGSVTPNLVLHGNMSITGVNANKQIDGIKDSSYDELSTTMWLFGAGVTYYFMPPNLYLTLAVGTSVLTERRRENVLVNGRIEDRTTAYVDSGAGFGTTLTVGKEWWVGRRGEWGIGAAITGAFYAAPVEIADVRSTFLGQSVSLSFSSTLN